MYVQEKCRNVMFRAGPHKKHGPYISCARILCIFTALRITYARCQKWVAAGWNQQSHTPRLDTSKYNSNILISAGLYNCVQRLHKRLAGNTGNIYIMIANMHKSISSALEHKFIYTVCNSWPRPEAKVIRLQVRTYTLQQACLASTIRSNNDGPGGVCAWT